MDSARPLTVMPTPEACLRSCVRPDISDCPDIVIDGDVRHCKLDAKYSCADPDWSDLPYKRRAPKAGDPRKIRRRGP